MSKIDELARILETARKNSTLAANPFEVSDEDMNKVHRQMTEEERIEAMKKAERDIDMYGNTDYLYQSDVPFFI